MALRGTARRNNEDDDDDEEPLPLYNWNTLRLRFIMVFMTLRFLPFPCFCFHVFNMILTLFRFFCGSGCAAHHARHCSSDSNGLAALTTRLATSD